jgi:hypothetical protein
MHTSTSACGRSDVWPRRFSKSHRTRAIGAPRQWANAVAKPTEQSNGSPDDDNEVEALKSFRSGGQLLWATSPEIVNRLAGTASARRGAKKPRAMTCAVNTKEPGTSLNSAVYPGESSDMFILGAGALAPMDWTEYLLFGFCSPVLKCKRTRRCRVRWSRIDVGFGCRSAEPFATRLLHGGGSLPCKQRCRNPLHYDRHQPRRLHLETTEIFPSGTGLEIVVRTEDLRLRIQGKVLRMHPGLVWV